MDAQKPLFWHQGLFLQPQHLQIEGRYQASLLEPFQRYLQPYFRGAADLSIREAGLADKSFEILRGEFVFPDGTHVRFPGNGVIKPRSFDEAWVEADKPFAVYLGLRKWNPSGENVTVVPSLDETAGLATRFAAAADPEDAVDLHAGGPTGKVKRLSYVPRVFWETEADQLDNYELIPVARLERGGEEIRLAREFVPPCLTMSASEFLVRTLKDVRDQITSRCRQLEEYKNPKTVQGLDFDLGYIVFLLALRSLNRHVPVFYHLAETKNVHPWLVYGNLRSLIGELSTFSGNLSASG